MPSGGGGRDRQDAGGPPQPDTSKPSPKAETPPPDGGETVAPDVQQSELTLRRVEDLFKENKDTSKLEEATGMSRTELQQFVEKFKKAPKSEPGPGREIEVKGDQTQAGARKARQLPPGPTPKGPFSTRSVRPSGSVARDQMRDNIEATSFPAPPELRSRFEAYKESLSRPRTLNPSRSAPVPGPNGR